MKRIFPVFVLLLWIGLALPAGWAPEPAQEPLQEPQAKPDPKPEEPRPPEPKPPEPPPKKIDPIQALVQELGADSRQARARAEHRLKRAGKAAIPALEHLAVMDSSEGRKAAEILAFVKGPGAEWGAWIDRLASPQAAAEHATIRAAFAKQKGAPIPFLQDLLAVEPDPALKQAATELLEKHCRFSLETSIRWNMEGDGAVAVVSGKTDLPDGVQLSVWVYAVFEGEGDSLKRYVSGESVAVSGGAFRVSFPPETIAPGRYEATVEAEPADVRRESNLMLALDPGTENERWIGGAPPRHVVQGQFGTPDQIAREREAGPMRVRRNLEDLGALYAKLAARVVWQAGPSAADEAPGALAKIAERLDSKDPAERFQARKDLAAAADLEPPVWGGLRAPPPQGTPNWEQIAGVLAALHRDWERQVCEARDAVSMLRFPGRDDRVLAGLTLYPLGAEKTGGLADRLLVLGRQLVGKPLLGEVLGPARTRTVPAGSPPPKPVDQPAWLAEYEQAIHAYVEDRIGVHLGRFERVRRQAQDRFAQVRRLPGGEAGKLWSQDRKGWERDLAAVEQEWRAEAQVPESAGAFAKKVAAVLGERIPKFDELGTSLRAVLESLERALAGKGTQGTEETDLLMRRFQEKLQELQSEVSQGVVKIGAARIHLKAREIEMDGQVSLRDGLLELLACTPSGKAYESLLVLDCKPSDLYYALLRLGLKAGLGPNMEGAEKRPRGDLVDLWVEWRGSDGGWTRIRAEDLVVNVSTGKTVDRRGWVFVGSEFLVETDPVTQEKRDYFMANATGSMATVSAGYNTSTILDSTLRLDYGETVAKPGALPEPGSPVRIRLRPIPSDEAEVLYKQMEDDLKERAKEETGKGDKGAKGEGKGEGK